MYVKAQKFLPYIEHMRSNFHSLLNCQIVRTVVSRVIEHVQASGHNESFCNVS